MVLGEKYQTLKYKTRVVVFVYNKGDYDEELEAVRYAARMSANRQDLRIGLVSKPKLVKQVKKSEQGGWFGDASMNSIVLKRYDNEIFHVDLLEVPIVDNAYFWIAKKSIREVE